MESQQIVIQMSAKWIFFGMVFLLLVVFGIGYNALVNRLGQRKEGYTSFLVVGGVLLTLTGSAFVIGLENTLMVLALFVASGVPMIIGEITRVIRARNKIYSEAERTVWQNPNP